MSFPNYIEYFLSLPVNDIIVYYFITYIGITLIRDILKTDFQILNLSLGYKFCFGVLVIFFIKTLTLLVIHFVPYLTLTQGFSISIVLLVTLVYFANIFFENVLLILSRKKIELATKEQLGAKLRINTNVIRIDSANIRDAKRNSAHVFFTNTTVAIIAFLGSLNSPKIVLLPILFMSFCFILRSSIVFFNFKPALNIDYRNYNIDFP